MSPGLLSTLSYLVLTAAADLAAFALARPRNLSLLAVAFLLALARAVALGLASRRLTQALQGPLDQEDADLAAAAHASARLPVFSMRVGLLTVLLSYGLVVATLPELALLYCAIGLPLQLLASVLHRFLVGGWLLESPRHALALRLGATSPPVGTPLRVKLLWVALASTGAGATLTWLAARAGSPLPTVAAVGLALLLALLVALLAARDVARSAERLAAASERLASGDLSETVALAPDDEQGRIAAGLRALAETARRASGAAGESMSTVGRHVAAVAGGAADAAAAVRAGSGSLATILQSAAELDRLARESSGDADKLASATRALTDAVTSAVGAGGDPALVSDAETLRRAAEAAGGASTELTVGISRLAQSVQGLSQSSLDTAGSTSAMDDAIARVRVAAADTAELSARVSGEAERGYRAVHKTLDEIERIRDLVEEARRTIDELGTRVGGIGAVVVVIEEIAQKTNLLALNASIIAAQAGQHGRGFAVVASEIKALAQRTAASTKEIGAQIAGVQEESDRAMSAMATGVDAVNQGFQVAVGAGDALGEIRQSARAAQKKVQGIARAMEEQAVASRRVADATGHQAQLSQQVVQAIREHAHGGQRIRSAADEMAEVAHRVEERLRTASAGAAGVDEALGDLTVVARDLLRQQKDRMRSAERLQAAVAGVREAEALTAERVKLLGQAAALLRDETAQLQRRLDQLAPS